MCALLNSIEWQSQIDMYLNLETNQIQMIAHQWTTKRLEQLTLFLNLQQKRGNLILKCQRQQSYFL